MKYKMSFQVAARFPAGMNEMVDFDEESWWDWEHGSSFEKDMKEGRFRRIAEYVLEYC